VPTTVSRSADSGADRVSLRAQHFDCLASLWRFSTLDRVRRCRRFGALDNGAGTLQVKGTGADRRAALGSMQTCASVWACPCCTEKIAARRQEELSAALLKWTARGGQVAMVTLTMRHHKGQALSELWDALSKAWGRVTSGRAWEAVHEQWGADVDRVYKSGPRAGEIVTRKRVGWCRVVETTHGENGWHVHVHAALFLAGDVDARAVDLLAQGMFQVWRSSLLASGLAAPSARNGGLDARVWDGTRSNMANYFTKNRYRVSEKGLAAEITRADRKHARDGHRTPWQILAAIESAPTAADHALWAEWEAASQGRRQLTWATGVRSALLPEPELSNEEIVSEDAEGFVDALVLPRETIAACVKARAWPELLNLLESDDDLDVVCHWFSDRDLSFYDPEDYWTPTRSDGGVDHRLAVSEL
jgi:hypothetical protein